MKRHSPRMAYRSSLAVGAVVLLVVGTFSHWRAFRLQRRAVLDRVASIEKRVELVEKQRVSPVSEPVSSVVEKHPSDDVQFVPRPRILGSGRSGKYVYIDVRLPSSQVNRYFLRADSTPLQVKRWIVGLTADVRDDLSALGW